MSTAFPLNAGRFGAARLARSHRNEMTFESSMTFLLGGVIAADGSHFSTSKPSRL